MGFFDEFHEQNMFVRSLNSTFLALIPKIGMQWTLRILDILVWWASCKKFWLRCWQKY